MNTAIMNKRELIIQVIENLGYKPQIDDDGDVVIRYQMKSVYVVVGDEDDTYTLLTLPKFYDVEDGEEHIALAVCNKLTRDLKMAKVYVDHTFKNVSGNCEFYYTDEESLKLNIENSLKILGVIRTLYKKAQDELLGQ